jgi:hypothetical protein
MTRTIAAAIVGLLAWWIAFYASLLAFVFAWPALRQATGPALESNDFSHITTPMWALFLAMYLWVNPIGGWATALMSNRRHAVWIVAGIMTVYAAFMHYYRLWGVYPDWYNLLVPVLIPPLMHVGVLAAKRASRT